MIKLAKYIPVFLLGFFVCPCPVHGTLLGLGLLGAARGAKAIHDHKHKKCLDKGCTKC